MKLKDLKTNPKNPRYLTEADFQKLLNKLLTFPRLLEKNKINFDSEQGNTILGGNMRFKALNYICDTYTKESIFDAVKTAQNSLNVDNADLMEESVTVFTQMIEKRSLPENWVQDAKGLSEEEKQAFIVIDNVSDGKWDFDALANNWDIDFEAWNVADFDSVSIDDIETSEEFDLPEGDKEPFQQMTFTLADAQAEQIKEAISEIKKSEDYNYVETFGNENGNGNALYLIIMQWAEQRK